MPIAVSLQRLLQRIEMEDQRIRLDHLDGTAAVIDGVAVVECTAPRLAKSRMSARDREHGRSRQSRPARCRSAVNPAPWRATGLRPAARLRLMARAASVPPVIEEISSGTRRRSPRSSTPGSIPARSSPAAPRAPADSIEAIGQTGEPDVFLQVDADMVRFAAVVSHGGLRHTCCVMRDVWTEIAREPYVTSR